MPTEQTAGAALVEQLIDRIKERVGSGQFQSEAAVREAIVLPVLQALGWEIFDPNSVLREYTLGSRRVDYALSSMPHKTDIFIEVKAVGQAVGADKQLFEYAFHEGIPFAILTDGREWNFFLPGEQGSYDERRVQKLDLIERPTKDSVEILRRYLEFGRVRSGTALESARDDYKSISKRKTAASKIPTAWHELVRESDEYLMDVVAEKTEAICGYRPAPEDVEEFLLGLTKGSPSGLGSQKPGRSSPASATPTQAPLASPVSERSIRYELFGQAKAAGSAIEALIDILRTLANRNPQFVERLAPAVRGRTRSHLARSRTDVYPQKPELTEYTIELVPGWWLGTNISNRDKMKIIQKACEVGGLKVGKDISIQLPNAG